ncbi:N-formimino-L-glutamate deiminase [compost metagenome]
MAVDQPGADPAAAAIDTLRRLQVRRGCGRANVHDATVGGGDHPVLDHAQAGAVHGNQVGVVPEGVTVHGSNHFGSYVYTI